MATTSAVAVAGLVGYTTVFKVIVATFLAIALAPEAGGSPWRNSRLEIQKETV